MKTIADRAFSGCAGFDGNPPAGRGVTKIGDFAFWKCSGLKRINLPDSLEEIGINAFEVSAGLCCPEALRMSCDRGRHRTFR
ncbi:MAG: leucine-rich repeat protein [Lentisphaeria bacterium]|nr:leucine-rich repeat protein [Lentisphaeria bacterium]